MKTTELNKLMAINTPLPNSTIAGLITASLNFLHSDLLSTPPPTPAVSSSSNAVLNLLPSPTVASLANFFARLLKIVTLYVSRKHVKNNASHPAATATAIHTTALHPHLSATALPIIGPNAPPTSDAKNSKLNAPPRSSGAKISPTIAGFSTFPATASPLSMRATTNCGTVVLVAATTQATMKQRLAVLVTA